MPWASSPARVYLGCDYSIATLPGTLSPADCGRARIFLRHVNVEEVNANI